MSKITDEAVISSLGMTSRELYGICDRPRNFYLMSAMGCELGLGVGLAYTRPDLKVMVISGDGSALMSFNTFLLIEKLQWKLKNLHIYILRNGCYASTGGQRNCSDVNLLETWLPNQTIIDISPEKGDAPRIPLTPEQITRRFKDAISTDHP